MKNFLPRYVLLLFVLFFLFYYETTPIAEWINRSQIDAIVFLMEMSLEPFQVVGRKILISDTYTLIVTQACNGMVPLWMFYASILAVRTAWVYQLKWMVAGYITIFVVNVFRIWFVAFFAKEMGQSSFFLAHDLVGNIILIVTGTLLFFIYLRHLPKGEKLKL